MSDDGFAKDLKRTLEYEDEDGITQTIKCDRVIFTQAHVVFCDGNEMVLPRIVLAVRNWGVHNLRDV